MSKESLTRRDFFRYSGTVLANLGIGVFIPEETDSLSGDEKDEQTSRNLIAKAMEYPVGSATRVNLEKSIIPVLERAIRRNPENWRLADQIISGLTNWYSRSYVLETIFQTRQTGMFPELSPLGDQEFSWAKSAQVDPVILAYCRENYQAGIELVHQRFPQIDPIQHMLTPGGTAALVMTETGARALDSQIRGFVNIGTGGAWEEINPTVFPKAREDLVWIASKATEETNLPFDYNFGRNIPGSERGNPDENESGGAISWQMIPTHIRKLWWTKDPQRRIPSANPFHPSSIPYIWLFLADKFDQNQSENTKKQALMTWNQNQKQAEFILKINKDYQKNFPFENPRHANKPLCF